MVFLIRTMFLVLTCPLVPIWKVLLLVGVSGRVEIWEHTHTQRLAYKAKIGHSQFCRLVYRTPFRSLCKADVSHVPATKLPQETIQMHLTQSTHRRVIQHRKQYSGRSIFRYVTKKIVTVSFAAISRGFTVYCSQWDSCQQITAMAETLINSVGVLFMGSVMPHKSSKITWGTEKSLKALFVRHTEVNTQDRCGLALKYRSLLKGAV